MNFFELLAKMSAQHSPVKIAKPRILKASKSPAMLARLYVGQTPASYACEPKIDGVRVIITADPIAGTVRFQTRNGNDLPSLSHLTSEVLTLVSSCGSEVTLDAEAVSGSSFFDGIGALRSTEPCLDASLWVFDLPDHTGTYSERREDLYDIFSGYIGESIRIVPSTTDMTPEQAFSLYLSQGFEGAMVKDTSAVYAKGKRSNAWLKVKDADCEDCIITDIVEGKGKCSGMAGHITVRLEGRTIRVGTGMTDCQRIDIFARRAELIGRTAEVGFHMKTPNGSLRHPTLMTIRGDK